MESLDFEILGPRGSGTMSARVAPILPMRILAVGFLILLAANAGASESTRVINCEDLAHETVPPEDIGLPTLGAQIDTAATVALDASRDADDFCRITGRIKAVNPSTPDIRFDVNLPRHWNGRALQIGGGGYGGVVVSGTGLMPFSPDQAPLARGYVTFGDDSGHVGNSALADFGLVDDAVINFGYAHLKKSHDVALALIFRNYGHAPERMYFAGGSTGGREGYTVMQRYPDDYDGVIANSPALNFSGIRLIGLKMGQAEYRSPGGFVPPALLELVYKKTLAVCDALDGAVDGIVSDVVSCRTREPEIVQALRCTHAAAKSSHDDCLTDAQIATLVVMRDGLTVPYRLAWDDNRYPGYNVFQGTLLTSGLGLAHEPNRAAQLTFYGNGYLYTQGDGYVRYFVARNATFDALNLDVSSPGKYREQLVELAHTIGAMNPDLRRYVARGGKLITLQGLADEVTSPNQTIAYHEKLVSEMGVETVNSFMRLYMVPGFQHGNGVFIPSVDLLGALDAWVTQGIAPENLVATDVASTTTGRTRPLCRYPSFPRYLGEGDLRRAASFRCAQP